MSLNLRDEAYERFRASVDTELTTPATSADAIDGIVPAMVATPGSLENVVAIVETAFNDRLALACVGGRTSVSLGNIPRALDVCVSTEALNRVVDHSADDMTITAEAGVSLADLDAVLASSAQRIAIDPASPRATLGGAVAANVTGGMAYSYGHPRDLVLGMTVVDGEARTLRLGGRVVKNVAGYDLARLFAGSFGTLGAIVDVTLRTHPRARHASTVEVVFDTPDRLDAARAALFSAPLPLAALDFSYSSVPQPTWSLVIRVEGSSLGEVDFQRTEIERLCGLRITTETDSWHSALHARDENVVVRVVALPTEMVPLARELAAIAGPGLRMAGRCGDGMLRAFMDGSRAAPAAAVAVAFRRCANARGLRAIIERLPADDKTRLDVWDHAPTGVELMNALKQRFDPHAIFAPGRFVGGI